ncbi:hypothetical protein VBD025_16770 [Virgibacillus flavescens]|uniref:hypothetical protein n=1 Tax=Virgibacillus flavescens TaxID=1611422 RepID=UPI003D328B59
MLQNNSIKIAIGIITVALTGYPLLTNNQDILLLPAIQGILGFVTATMLLAGVSAFRKKRKIMALFYTIVTVYLACLILFNNSMTFKGLLPVLVIYIVGGVPIGIMAMFAYRLENKNRL